MRAFPNAFQQPRVKREPSSKLDLCLVVALVVLIPGVMVFGQTDGIESWRHRHPLPFGAVNMTGVVYGESGGYVAVGELGAVARALDGQVWELGESGTSRTLNGVGYGQGLYVVVGDAGTVLTSVDGLEWVRRTSGTSERLLGVTHGPDGFVAVGDRGVVLRSVDGVEWVLMGLGTNLYFNAVIHGGGLYVAVGNAGLVVTSADGLDWTEHGVPGSLTLRDVAYGAGVYVASANQQTVFVSVDGMDWESRSLGGLAGNAADWVSYGNGMFLLGGPGLTVWESVDGMGWATSGSGTGGSFTAVRYGAAGFVGVGWGGWVGLSADGFGWVPVREGSLVVFNAVGYGAGLFVAVGGNAAWTSEDGVSWVERSMPLPSPSGVTYGNELWVAVGSSRMVVVSSDGINWDQVHWSVGATFNGVAYGGGLYVTVGSGGEVWTSVDGLDWTPRDSGTTRGLNGVAYGAGQFVVVGDAGEVLVSEDGMAWESRSSGSNATLNDVAYANGLWVTVGSNGTLRVSLDTVDWYGRPVLGSLLFRSVAAHGEGWVVVGNDGLVMLSDDGLYWAQAPRSTSTRLNGLAYGQETLVAVGQTGTILQSGKADPGKIHLPVILRHPQSQRVVMGQSVSFGVVAGGAGDLSYQWRKEGIPIPGATGSALALGSVDAADTARYDVVVTGATGVSISGAASLRVLEPTEPAAAWWSARDPLPFGLIELNGVEYGESGGYVAVGELGTVARSWDGLVWELGDSGTSRTLNGVGHGQGLYVVVGDAGTVLTSVDGLEWVRRTSGTSERLLGVTHGPGGFVAVGDRGVVLRSVDGVGWTPMVLGSSLYLRAVIHGSGRYVAVGNGGVVLISEDGLEWSQHGVPGGVPLRAVSFGSGVYVASAYQQEVFVSLDGMNWESPSLGGSGSSAADWVCYGNGVFVLGGQWSFVWRSVDGLSWEQDTSGMTGTFNAVSYGPEGFVGVGAYGWAGRSVDGINWVPVREGGMAAANAVGYGAGLFVAMSGSVAWTSEDGISWVERSMPALSSSGVTYGNGLWVAVGGSRAVAVSLDGINWEQVHRSVGAAFNGVAYGEGFYVTVGSGGEVWISVDGLDWMPQASGTTRGLNGVAHGAGQFVVVGDAGEVLVSEDGMGWESRSSGTTATLNDVAYANGLWVVVGSGSTVLVSANLLDWVPGSVPGVSRNLRAVAAGNGWFAAVGNQGSLYLSRNGLDWTLQPAGTGADLWGISFGGDTFLSVGAGGLIQQSGKMEPGVEFFPAILNAPSSQTLSAGDDLILTIQVGGTGPFAFQWRRNGVNLPGETAGTLVLQNVQPWDSGNYSVAVSTSAGAVNSQIATVLITAPPLPFADRFADAGLLPSDTGVGSGNNTTASVEAGEPWPAGRQGSRSVWLRWIPASSGVATLSTLGSNFDTLLAVYTGDAVDALTSVAADDDSGSFLTSTVTFSVVAGVEYRIVVDGFGGAAGNIILAWDLEPSAVVIPRITGQPRSGSVLPGEAVFLEVVADGSAALAYQWYFNGIALIGATDPVLVIDSFERDNVGVYIVEVSTATGSTLSQPAVLELGAVPEVTTTGKMQELLMGTQPDPLQPMNFGAAGFVSVSAGPIISQVFDTLGAVREEGEPNHAGRMGGSSRWFGLWIETEGFLVVDTEGSEIDTVLAVYTLPGQNLFDLQLEASDDDSAPDGVRSRVQLPVRPGPYLIAVDGVDGATGRIQLNWQLGSPARITIASATLVAFTGDRFVLTADVTGFPPPKVEWRHDGVLLEASNAPELWLDPVEWFHAGLYSIRVENFAGRETSRRIELIVHEGAPRMSMPDLALSGEWVLELPDSPTWNVVVEVSSDLQLWIPVFTNAPGAGPVLWTDETAVWEPLRFYRLSLQP
jgi:hypothetical protein